MIVKGAISLAHGLRLRVVAEGVETEGQRNILCNYNCDEIQGFYYSRPLAAADFFNWVKERQSQQIRLAVG